ncbi:MAG: hypothetical protein ABI488_04220 [Polyangiaceae bacterium]
MSEDIRILRAVHGSARADGSAHAGRISFRLSGTPERRWHELFEANKGKGFSTEERGTEFLLHVDCVPGEVALKRDAAAALLADVNSRWRSEVTAQSAKARERHEQKKKVEDALNQELELLNFDRA